MSLTGWVIMAMPERRSSAGGRSSGYSGKGDSSIRACDRTQAAWPADVGCDAFGLGFEVEDHAMAEGGRRHRLDRRRQPLAESRWDLSRRRAGERHRAHGLDLRRRQARAVGGAVALAFAIGNPDRIAGVGEAGAASAVSATISAKVRS